MIAGRVSVVIPTRHEPYLAQTVKDLLAKATDSLEIIVVLDGYWDVTLPADPRVKVLHFGSSRGMRAAITAAVQMSTGQYLLKCDAHTMWDQGYDTVLKADYHEDNWILVPRRYALDAERWAIDESNPKYPIDYHYLDVALHGVPWTARREIKRDILLDDEMSSQGSAYFLSRKCWDWLGGLDEANFGPFWREMQELGLKCWLSGGAMKVTKRTWYAHLRKKSRGYSMDTFRAADVERYTHWFFLTDQPFPNKTRSLEWLLDHFAPVPTWPDSYGFIFDEAKRTLVNPYQVAA